MGVGFGVAVGLGGAVGLGVAVGFGVAVGLGVAIGVGDGVTVGLGVGSATGPQGPSVSRVTFPFAPLATSTSSPSSFCSMTFYVAVPR